MSPNETLFLESTNKIAKSDISNSSFVQFQIWDFPGQIDFFEGTFDAEEIFGKCGALVFVIDAQDDYTEALQKLHQTVTKAHKVNPNITFEVFIHKSDGLSDEQKIGGKQYAKSVSDWWCSVLLTFHIFEKYIAYYQILKEIFHNKQLNFCKTKKKGICASHFI